MTGLIQLSDYSYLSDGDGDANQPLDGNLVSRSNSDKSLSETELSLFV